MHKIKRSALHELVWAKPMTQIGKELGISDVGLAKACRRHCIPVPPRGHWAKLAAGKHWASPSSPDTSNDMMCSGDRHDKNPKELHGRIQT